MESYILLAYIFAPLSHRGLSRLSDQGRMVATSGGSRPNKFSKCAIVGLRTTFDLYIVMCVINMKNFDEGVNTAWLGSRIFQGDYSPLWSGYKNPDFIWCTLI